MKCRSCLYYTLLVSLVSPAPKWAADRRAGSKSKRFAQFLGKTSIGMATAFAKGEQGWGRRPNTWVTKIEEFTRWKRWDNWQNVAVRNPALWEQSMLEFVQFAVSR